MKGSIAAAALLLVPAAALAASVEAGRAKVAEVCAACHGENGQSVADNIPNLGGQRARYIEIQLRALKDGARRNGIMNSIAAQLSSADIDNVAAYFSSQKGAGSERTSDFMPNIARTRVTFPDNYLGGFWKYNAANFADLKQVRHYYANASALQAAKAGTELPDGAMLVAEVFAAKLDAAGQPIKGSDGVFVTGPLLFYSTMARGSGWGRDLPDMLRNRDWNYAAFTPAKQQRSGINHAECLACHKAQEKESFTFTLTELTEFSRKRWKP